jgi:cytoskeletal protein CcmA (bactofilin family)
MRKSVFILAAAVLLLLFPALVFAQTTKVVTLSAGEIVNHDYFAAGDTVHVSGTVHGDVYAAGQTVIVDGTVDGDVIAAAKTLTVSGSARNLRIAGQTVTINGRVTGNITGAAKTFAIQQGASISGSLVEAGNDIMIASSLGKGATIWGQNTTITAPIHGDVTVTGTNLDLENAASISGNLTTSSDLDMTKSPNSSIAGQTTQMATASVNSQVSGTRFHQAIAPFITMFKFASFVSVLLTALLLILFIPRQLLGMADIFLRQPGRSLGIGALVFIGTPIVIFILFITLIGIPIAFILLLIYIICLYFAKIVGIFAISRKLFGSQKMHLFLAFAITLIIFEFVQLLPIIGGLATGIIFLMGLGAMLTEKRMSLINSKTQTPNSK